MLKMSERFPRSIIKAITWRIMMTCTNFIGAWWISGDWKVGVGVASFALVVNSTLYIIHERSWNKAEWGRKVVSEEGDIETG